MTRHVKFSQKTTYHQEDFKLPNILINNRIAGGGHGAGRAPVTTESFPTPKQNGHLLSGEGTPPAPRLTFYHSVGGSRVRAENAPRKHNRRLQSLPPRKPKADDESPRLANSAPSRKGQKAVAPLPKLNNLMAKLKTSEREQTYGKPRPNDHAGISTKAHESQNQKSQKFATSWANARAEQPKLRSDDRSSPNEKREALDKKSDPFHAKSERKQPPVISEVVPKEREKIVRKNDQTLSHMFHASEKENTSPVKQRESPYLDMKARERRVDLERRDWNPSYVVPKPVASRRRDEDTHQPALTDANELYKAYTGRTKRELRRCDDTISRSGSQYGEVYQATITISPRNKKEYVLTLREADAYKKINSVYGSDSFRKKRKSYLLQKLMTVEVDQIKIHNQSVRERERKKVESKRRQQKQLHHLRRRFKDQQCRRFRSQYVTSRVLEHEKMNRKLYGLPEENASEKDEEEEDLDVPEDNSEESEKSRRKKDELITSYDKKKKRKAYERKYKNMFDISVGPSWDPRATTPKMEGVDIVAVEVKGKDGKVKERKTDVKDIVRDAKKLLQTPSREYDLSLNESRLTTPISRSTHLSRRRPSLDSLELDDDDDDDDIFERARRKYNLDVDSQL
ncbi:DNA ligase 1-like isoform X2 [Haliotis rufescens]|uniref:DNA ligase 1-like isoform X2 n=1 Tax=Haliotis rufescens TaxID=6454 RepID=UPI00201F570D|nr:DNA ligase 1-like isoform X2 [Haliotis rufescens]